MLLKPKKKFSFAARSSKYVIVLNTLKSLVPFGIFLSYKTYFFILIMTDLISPLFSLRLFHPALSYRILSCPRIVNITSNLILIIINFQFFLRFWFWKIAQKFLLPFRQIFRCWKVNQRIKVQILKLIEVRFILLVLT